MVHRWALVHTGDPMEADDLTQDVSVQMIRNTESFHGDARSAAIDPAKEAERHELREMLLVFFERLQDRQREVFDLVELQGLSGAEVSQLLGIEPVTVRATSSRPASGCGASFWRRAPSS